MAENTRAKGGMGEAAAKKYLESCGYKILETNFKTVFGEADIIAEKDGVIVFCEIKSRASAAFG
ncbi:MAG TPA: YraN family protein, partial [Clostridia bacterium]|nr:YraN family protein [Clostridia bacterium]